MSHVIPDVATMMQQSHGMAELGRLFSCALCDPEFATILLADPELAVRLTPGQFCLTRQERHWLVEADRSSLRALATAVLAARDRARELEWRRPNVAQPPAGHSPHGELERLVSMAATYPDFGRLLVRHPAQALPRYRYVDDLSPQEYQAVVAFGESSSIYTFAAKVEAILSTTPCPICTPGHDQSCSM